MSKSCCKYAANLAGPPVGVLIGVFRGIFQGVLGEVGRKLPAVVAADRSAPVPRRYTGPLGGP